MMWLIKHSLKAGVLYQGEITLTTEGVPQGSPIAPLYIPWAGCNETLESLW